MKRGNKRMISSAINLAYTYFEKNYDIHEFEEICTAIKVLANKEDVSFFCINEPKIYTYDGIQDLLSKLNEKESIRKKNGVYYTPPDLVSFIVINSVKSLYGKLDTSNISQSNIEGVPYKSFCKTKTVYDPTCGAGEFLLFTAGLKFDLWSQNDRLTENTVFKIISTINGNDLNPDSVFISKLRLFILTLKHFRKINYIKLAQVLNSNFTTIDFVSEPMIERKFHIIIGNPPYVEDFKSGLKHKNRYGNIYANVLKNASDILEENGSLGFVIPISYISTPRMKKIREDLFESIPVQYILNYADRPDCLFDSVHQKLSVLIGKKRKCVKTIYTSAYHYWYKDERKYLFQDIEMVKNIYATDNFIPKLGNRYDVDIYKKIVKNPNMISVYDTSRFGNESVYLNRRETFWMKAYRTFVADSDYKVFSYENESEADFCYCLINSSLFWWYWIAVSDCWHVSKELNGFRTVKEFDIEKVMKMAMKLRTRLEETKVFVGTKQTDYEYKHKFCLPEIHEIDNYINELYGLTEEESNYIKEYALNYRTGGGAN